MRKFFALMMCLLMVVGTAWPADFNQPTVDSFFVDYTNQFHDIINDVSKWLDGTGTTNIPHTAKRWNDTTKIFEVYSGASPTWRPLASRYGIDVNDASTLGGYTPSQAATANVVAVRDASGKLAGGITGNAATVGGYTPSQTATANGIAVRDASGNLAGNILGNAATATTATNVNMTGETYASGTSITQTLNMGTVTAGDRILVSAISYMTNTTAPTNAYLLLNKASGTATISMGDNITFAGNGLTPLYNGGTAYSSITAVIKVTGSGTLVLQSGPNYSGGAGIAFNHQIYAVFLKKQ